MVEPVSLLLVLVMFAAGGLMAFSQARYLPRYREARGIDPLQMERIGPAPWLFFTQLPRIMRELNAAYSNPQPEPELEALRRRVQQWQRVAVVAWALLVVLAVVRLTGLA